MIERTNYLNELIKWKDQNLIKVVTGIRRCGKSTLFDLYIEYLIKEGIDRKHIIKINLEDPQYNFNNYMELYNYINDMLKEKKKYYVFIDEVQNIPQFQKALDGLYIKDNVDLYVTGSNAFLLSGDIATLIAGRYIEIKMYPLSFKEYISAFEDNNYQKLFNNYLKYGGFPEVINLIKKDEEMVNKYLDTIFVSVVYKDVITRYNIADPAILESIIKYILENVGSPISTKKVTDTLISMNRKTSNPTVENYIKALIDSYLLMKVDRFDIAMKNTLSTGYKYYSIDIGLKNYLAKKKLDTDMGHIIENIVAIELVRRGYNIYVGKQKDYEVDFVAKKNNEIIYYQVAYTLSTDTVRQRELRPLQKIQDNYPKYILTLDPIIELDDNGIKILNLIDWLLDS